MLKLKYAETGLNYHPELGATVVVPRLTRLKMHYNLKEHRGSITPEIAFDKAALL